MTVTVIMGDLAGAVSSARVFRPLVGAEVDLAGNAETRLPLVPDSEYAALCRSGPSRWTGCRSRSVRCRISGSGRSDLELRSDGPGRVLLIGGEPFDDQIDMWWNFIGRHHDEIVAARDEATSSAPF